MNPSIRVTFGLIVLNGEPFTRYCLRSLYAFAHQIIVVEGAAPGAAKVADAVGHSSDGTLDSIRRFQADEDPDEKVVLVTAEDEGYSNGYWPGEKDEQSRAYASRADGDYLWQVDIDEFYRPEDMQAVLQMLDDNPEISGVSFRQRTFWGGFDYTVDGPYVRYHKGVCTYRRLFRWGPDYEYVTHRPPTVHDAQGRDMMRLNWLDGRHLARRGIQMYHYSLVFPKQVQEKCRYHTDTPLLVRSSADRWAQEAFRNLRRPFHVHNVYTYPSWIDRYHGSHPPQIQLLRKDLDTGRCPVAQRPTEDIDRLLSVGWYRLGRSLLRAITPLYRVWFGLLQTMFHGTALVVLRPCKAWQLVRARLES